jgi:dCMP deaminase
VISLNNQKRLNKTEYYLGVAEQVAVRSTCIVSKYGAVIVKNDIIVSTGYNGSPRGVKNCSDLGVCIRDCEGTRRYNSCRAVHSEANALLQASYNDLIGSTLYIARYGISNNSNEQVEPCMNCKRLIMNAQIEKVICRQNDSKIVEFDPKKWIELV